MKKIKNYIKIPDGELYFEQSGNGKPLILIHAGFSDSRDWRYQINDLSKSFRVITYDQRGSGNSSILTTAFSPADDLKHLMDYLNIDDTILIGHSIGGTIALDFYLQFPEKVSSLILIAPGINGYVWSKEYLELMSTIWTQMQPEVMVKKFLNASFYKIAMGNQSIKFEIEKITKENFQKIMQWKTFDINDVKWFHPNAILEINTIKIPTLIIYGDQDSGDIRSISYLLNNNIRNSELLEIREVDHLLNFEKPGQINAIILDFLSRNKM